jgi:single-stranded-DNA-specific exonuclease
MKVINKFLENEIKPFVKKFLEASENKEIYIISHFDTDGISSAAIMIQTLKRLDKIFTLKIQKSLEPKFIKSLPKDKLILFLDLASGSLHHIENSELENVFIIDHHQISQKQMPENVTILNPELTNKQKISASGLVYLFCKEINENNKDLAKLAVLGMVGDCLEKEIEHLNNGILEDGEIQRKRGLLIFPSTRPLNRTLEYCSNPYIPGVTGDIKGVLELLREAGLTPNSGKYKSILELNHEEMERLTTSILLRSPKAKNSEIIGDVFLIKLFNKQEDAREISAKINACSRYGEPETALQLCLEIPQAKKKAEQIHVKYKQTLIDSLRFAEQTEKIKGKNLVIINAQSQIKDTMIGTVASILSNSSIYPEGTMITAMAYYEDKIKVSARSVGKTGKNLKEILNNIIKEIGGEVGGHEFAAGCIINQNQEKSFIEILKKSLEVEMIKI